MLSLPAAGQLPRRSARCPVGEINPILGGLGMEPTRLFPIIVLLSLVTVEYGGWALLGFLTGRGTLSAFRERFFAAGGRGAGPVRRLLRAPGARPAGPQFARHGADPGRGAADRSGVDHRGHRP